MLRPASCVLRMRRAPVGRRVLMLAFLFSLVAGAAVNPHDADAQTKGRRGAIYFQVIDTSVNPLAGAEIVLPHLGLAVQLADEGSLLLVDVPNGTYLVQARHLGYQTEWRVVRVTGDTARAHFMLTPGGSHALDTVSVVAAATPLETRLRDFLRRSTSSPSGYFLTREDVERRRPADVAALLQTVSGVVVQRSMPGPTFVRSRRSSDSRCSYGMLVFLDGVLVSSPAAGMPRQRVSREDSLGLPRARPGGRASGGTGTSGGRGGRRGAGATLGTQLLGGEPLTGVDPNAAATTASLFDLNQVPLSTVAGVEVYPSLFGVPPEFRLPGAECGVVLIWTAGR